MSGGIRFPTPLQPRITPAKFSWKVRQRGEPIGLPMQLDSISAHRTRTGTTAAALVVTPLLLGGFVYLGFRSDALLMFRAVRALGLKGEIEGMRRTLAPLGPHLPTWVVYSLPHALWTFSMLAFFTHVWRAHPGQRRAWVAVAVAGSVGSELLQSVEVIPGTFSIPDLLGIACACLAYALLCRWLYPGPRRAPDTLTLSLSSYHGNPS